ncbi:MAG TPA: amino acid ABC transporter permease [Verrucomicrobiae bacterium]|nr:amino acid ABC transporter permease [Verrucomicrobiae bacterium]
MQALKSIRPSNLVILFASPFLVYLFFVSSDYLRSLRAILGIEDNALQQFVAYFVLLAVLVLGLVAPVLRHLGKLETDPWRLRGWVAALLCLAVAVYAALSLDMSAFVNSVVSNSVDPFTSTLIVPAKTPRQLTPEALTYSMDFLRSCIKIYIVAAAALTALAYFASKRASGRRLASAAFLLLAVINGGGALYLLLFAYVGFAAGLAVTLRAGIFGYVGAAILGLIWTGLRMLKPKRWTFVGLAALSVVLLAGSAYLFSQPTDTFVLVGTLEKQMAIVKGTPEGLVDAVKSGSYEGGSGQRIQTRSAVDVNEALELMKAGDKVSSTFIPESQAPADLPVIWRVTFLPDKYKLPGVALGIVGIFVTILIFGGLLHGRHPMAIAADFFIDIARGIPMLVIILYVGFPLASTLKDSTGGYIDLPNLTRGIVALSIGYSAYMAEIFRAGIEAVPRGQVEAARSLGLKNWQVARLIVLPQALRVIIPPLGNEFIAILKDTSLLTLISVRDVLQRMREFQSAYFLVFPPFNTVAIVYVFLTLSAASALQWIERRYSVKAH